MKKLLSREDHKKNHNKIWKKEHYKNKKSEWLKGNPINKGQLPV